MLERERIELESLMEEAEGLLTTDMVIDAAADPTSALHKHFEWDDSEAAAAYRKQQARALIARCKITVMDSTPVVVRAFVSVPSDRRNGEGGGYRARTAVVADAVQRLELLDDMTRWIEHWNREASMLTPAVRNAIVNLSNAISQAKRSGFVEQNSIPA